MKTKLIVLVAVFALAAVAASSAQASIKYCKVGDRVCLRSMLLHQCVPITYPTKWICPDPPPAVRP